MKQGWEIKKLGDLCNLMTGGTPSRSKKEYFQGGTIKWLVSGDIHKREIIDCEGRITELGMANSNAKLLPVNSVMIALNGQGKTRGTVAILRTNATCNQSLVSIYPKDTRKLLPEFIFCNLHGRYEEIRKITGDDDNDRRGLNMPLIRNIEIPLPPLSEQQRIVSILDEAFAAIAKAKANAEQNLKNAKELFESYLQGVFEKKGEGWETDKFVNLCNLITCGVAATPKYVDESVGVPFLSAQNVRDGEVVLDKFKYISKEFHSELTKKNKPQKGDILYSRVGAKYGEAGVVEHDFEFSVYVSVTLIKPKPEKLDNYFLKHLLNSPSIKEVARKSISSSGVPNLNVKDVREFLISYPSITIQKKIVSEIEIMRAETQKLEAVYQQKITDLEELKKSILQKAFAGELKTEK